MPLPFLLQATDPRLTDTPSTNLLTRNPFLIFRLVFLALLGNLALLSLIFASWNINAALSAEYPVSSSSVFVILESCVFLILGTLSVLAFFRRKDRICYTIVECGWVGVMSLFYTGTAIAATISGPALSCGATANWSVCASSMVLVPVTWLSSFLSLGYFLAMFVTALAHQSLYNDIWMRSIYTIQWFGQPQQLPTKEKVVNSFFKAKTLPEEDPYFDYYEDIESTAGRKKLYAIRDSVEESIPWGGPAQIRRGIDAPFATKPSSSIASHSAITSPTLHSLNLPLSPITLPERLAGPGVSGSRYLEKFRESTVLSRSEDTSQYAKHYHHQHSNSFPPSVVDMDKPIPLTRLSKWVRADSSF